LLEVIGWYSGIKNSVEKEIPQEIEKSSKAASALQKFSLATKQHKMPP